jgi:hypothetical protein
MASTATVIHRYDGSQPSENAIKQRSRQNTGGYQPVFHERASVSPAMPGMAMTPPTEPSSVGTFNANMVPTLKEYKIVAFEKPSPSFKQLRIALKSATLQNPVILREPSHIVVCDGKWPGAKGSFIICDPARGLCKAQLVDANPPKLQYNSTQFPIDRMWTTQQDMQKEVRVQMI